MLLTRTRVIGAAGLLLLVAAVPASHNVSAAGAPIVAPAQQPAPATASSVFRLGTAGRPFGWSTAVGDFNADGRPDVIVADRASEWSRGGGYRLDFAISGEAAMSDSIEVPEDAVGIRIADVDHDSDLDVVLASTISGRTIGVWLNDGAGHFTRSPLHVASPAQLTPEALDQPQADETVLSAEVPSRRMAALAPVQARAPAPASSSLVVSPLDASASLVARFSANPRAPPAISFSL